MDSIKEVVYGETEYEGREVGTSTIFQGDLRIATNVMTSDGRRGTGTRMSAEVFDRVAVSDETRAALERVHAPIGLDLGGRSPAEIAVSILAEMLAVRHDRPEVRSMRERRGSKR